MTYERARPKPYRRRHICTSPGELSQQTGRFTGPGTGEAYAQPELKGTVVEMRAGASALHEAARSRLHAAEYERLALESLGWRVLADRRWAGSNRANVDVQLVGPGGVVVVDAKTWHLSTSFRTS